MCEKISIETDLNIVFIICILRTNDAFNILRYVVTKTTELKRVSYL